MEMVIIVIASCSIFVVPVQIQSTCAAHMQSIRTTTVPHLIMVRGANRSPDMENAIMKGDNQTTAIIHLAVQL